MDETGEIVSQLTGYGSLIINSLYFMIAGMLVIYGLYKFANLFLNRFLTLQSKGKRLKMVVFGTLYVLVFVITALLVLKRLGYDVSAVGQLSILIVLIGSVIAFFVVPFLPKLPFVIGNMVEISGILGIVNSISTFHTTLRTLDGNIVYIPNALLMASRIVNYHQTPDRRIELNMSVGVDCDLELSKKFLFEIMSADERVRSDPAPMVYVLDANAAGVEMVGFCWVSNANWFTTRSDLWLLVVDKFQNDPAVNLSLDKQEVLLSGEVSRS
ncbi:MAG: mechanosensitive ion channel [Gammaproteobacteria bacterium]|nr:mechanosensitive ion channel [Gammaproteobacteria bacterium]